MADHEILHKKCQELSLKDSDNTSKQTLKQKTNELSSGYG